MQSYKHRDTRPFIPSKEEAGMEDHAQFRNPNSVLRIPLNPVVTRGQDPELFWMHKYGPGDDEETKEADIRSLYRHEHISPELLINRLYRQEAVKPAAGDQLGLFAPDVRDLFGNSLDLDEFEKVGEYYRHQGDWSNRLIQGDSLLSMTSLLEREGFAGKVQMIYFDPPYGIRYGSNWQLQLHNRDVKDGADEHLSAEPEQIKAFRDTWELGIHSYLSYLRDRLLVARELLTESGSCFVQISDENVHLVRCLMDEVFGSGNFVSLVTIVKTSSQESDFLSSTCDYLVWYAKSKDSLKYRKFWQRKDDNDPGTAEYNRVELADGSRRKMTPEESGNWDLLPENSKPYRQDNIVSQRPPGDFPVEFEGEVYRPITGYWKTGVLGMKNLIKAKRIEKRGRMLSYVRFFYDFPFKPISNYWQDVRFSSRSEDKMYVVQTSLNVIQRCLLMTTDPGDLVLDPTCGSGTTAYVAEQWGRRWITLDTSRIALNIAKTRLMTAVFPYYHLYSDVQVETKEANGKIKKTVSKKQEANGESGDVRQGFVYEEVPHITLKSLANDEPPETETLYDKPLIDKSRLRVAGPFTVETLQNYEPAAPDQVAGASSDQAPLPFGGGVGGGVDTSGDFETKIFEHLKVAGVMNGAKNERAVFSRVERTGSPVLHAEGFYDSATGERKAYLHIGPQFGTVSKQSVNEAVKECRSRGDADWLVILGFSFESDIANQSVTQKVGSFEVTKVRMHDDLLQEGLTKKDRKAASFVTIGEPDVVVRPTAGAPSPATVQVEIQGLDIYDPIRDEVRARSVQDIAYWMLDDDYDGSNFIVRQVFFCGGDKDEFDKWKRGLTELMKQQTKARAERTLRLELDDEAWDRLYGHMSHPIPATPGRKVAVRVVSQFGEESMKVVNV